MVAKKIAQFRLTLFRVQRAGWVWFERLAGRNRIYFWTPVELQMDQRFAQEYQLKRRINLFEFV